MNRTGVPVARLGWRLARHDPRRFVRGALLWIGWAAGPAVVGLGLKAVFDAISAGAAGARVPALGAGLLGVEALRLALFFGAIVVLTRWWVHGTALLRTNLLHAQVVSGGPEAGPPVARAGAAIPVFRDDVNDLMQFIDSWIDLAGVALYSLVALTVMVRVDALLTLVVALPIALVVVANVTLRERLRQARRSDREATARVTGLLGNFCAAVLAVKVAGAEERIVGRLGVLNRERGRTALRDKVLTQTLDAFNSSTVDVSIGLVLVLVAGAMRAGEFTVGDLALFASYIGALAGLPRWVGLVLARHRHAQVAVRRMASLLPGDDPAPAVAHRRLPLVEGAPLPLRPRPPRPSPAGVELRGFGVRHGQEPVLAGIDLDLPPGSFTVVCGAVGSGKTALLRGVLGLAGAVQGEVRWNGTPVGDPAAHMVPPNAAYVPQVPRLYSATLRDNLTLGVTTSGEQLAAALRTAAFDGDVAAMPEGLDTLVGPRGVRLSGGQLQRAATARALVADPALLVLDDLSSALDAATEQRLWLRLLGQRTPPTVLVVSHRAAALAHADQVVVLDGGRVAACGPPGTLRARGLEPLRQAEAG